MGELETSMEETTKGISVMADSTVLFQNSWIPANCRVSLFYLAHEEEKKWMRREEEKKEELQMTRLSLAEKETELLECQDRLL